MIIAVDFDGTIVEHAYPRIGKEKPFAIETLRTLAAEGHRLILWTAREGELLEDAVRFCRDRGLQFYAVNSDYPEGSLVFGERRERAAKVKADIYIDDRNLGGIPDWGTIYDLVSGRATASGISRRKRHKKGFWHRLCPWFSR